MIPTHSVFWVPMAITIMGGLASVTVLTIFFIPTLYAAWFRIEKQGGLAEHRMPRGPAFAS